jgi:arylformamidase
MKWLDVSIPLKADTTVWPGDPAFEMSPGYRIAKGDFCNLSRLSISTHTGTHCDAPWHFLEGAKTLDEMDTDLFFGSATVIDVGDVPLIHADDLGAALLPPRVLLKTTNSRLSADGVFHKNYVSLAPDAAQRMVEEGVNLVGIDYLSIAAYDDQEPTHHILLRQKVLIIEGLRLAHIPPGPCEFIVLPLHILGADGAPCRAFVNLQN